MKNTVEHGLVIHGETGILVKRGGWVYELIKIMASSEDRQRLGLAARAHVQKYYEQAASNKAYARVIAGVL